MTNHITTTITAKKNNNNYYILLEHYNLCGSFNSFYSLQSFIYVYREKHKAQILLSNWWRNSNFTIKWSRQLFFLAKLGLSLVYRSVSSIHFFPFLKNRENDMGLGKNGTKLWLVKLQSGNIRERERERALTYSVLAGNTKNGTKSPFFMICFSLPLSMSSHLRKEKLTHTQLHTQQLKV